MREQNEPGDAVIEALWGIALAAFDTYKKVSPAEKTWRFLFLSPSTDHQREGESVRAYSFATCNWTPPELQGFHVRGKEIYSTASIS